MHDGQEECGETDADVLCESCRDGVNTEEKSKACHGNGGRGSLGKSSCVTGAVKGFFLMSVLLYRGLHHP